MRNAFCNSPFKHGVCHVWPLRRVTEREKRVRHPLFTLFPRPLAAASVKIRAFASLFSILQHPLLYQKPGEYLAKTTCPVSAREKMTADPALSHGFGA
jgi:hypothetical protein